MSLVVCADVGSTYTKVVVVGLGAARVVASAAHRTTSGCDLVAAAAERLPVGSLPAAVAAGPPFDAGTDRELACLAATVAVRRHARGGPRTGGWDLRDVRLVVGSGGVLRPGGGAGRRGGRLAAAAGRRAGGGRDVCAGGGGLLAEDHPAVVVQLLRAYLMVR